MPVLCRAAARNFAAETAKLRDTVTQIWMTRHAIVRSNAFDTATREGSSAALSCGASPPNG